MTFLERYALKRQAIYANVERENQEKSNTRSALQSEYEVCSTRADALTNLIWTWGTALVGLNAAGIGILADSDEAPDPRFLLVVAAATAGTFLITWWNFAADRWHVIIRISYERLKDIECQLGMAHNLYISEHDEDGPPAELRKRLRSATGYPEKGFIGLNTLRSHLAGAVALMWSILIVVEAITLAAGGQPCFSFNEDCRTLPPDKFRHFVLLLISGIAPLLVILFGYGWFARTHQKWKSQKKGNR